ncbi:hypothetical protein G6N05_10630 [Flavobacterium sp. F372]|uniref:DUF4476 domain-containing protein n=1 Tax=Flavobacterium bernardetii TaxID=2813823 RepID=A0ABR7IYM6_9FLAO|nr:hypothetical protein [Flavobacterium bernardetii]MBC5834883.1 hypothetical protein [Flavobacterium bernardetii]NHF70564.1 hypothetical protein [Flavobacterium bernardetii]
MKKNVVLLLIIFPFFLFSQIKEKNNIIIQDSLSKDKICNYQNEVLKKIYTNKISLTKTEFDKLINLNKTYWTNIEEGFILFYSYSNFLKNNLNALESYNYNMLIKLNEYLHNEDTNEIKNGGLGNDSGKKPSNVKALDVLRKKKK